MARASRRERIEEAFDGLCAAIGGALGAAEGARDTAVRAHAEAMVEMWLRTDGLDAAAADPALAGVLANPQLKGPVRRVADDRDAAFSGWLDTGPSRVADLLAEAAPGSAGLDPDRWLGEYGQVAGAGPVPALWRIGTGHIGTARGTGRPEKGRPTFEVAVPLLDEAHLQISSTHETRPRAETLVEGLLMRVVSYFQPGMVALHVWDVGQFAGALPGLYPLTRTGLLTVHDPGRLPHLLEELSDRIRRVQTRLLVDGRPSLAALPTETGGRSEPWMVAVLLGNRSALREEDHRQLQRVARGGAACGVALVLVDVPMTIGAAVETIHLRPGSVSTSMTGPHVTVDLDPPLPPAEVTAACHEIASEHERLRSAVAVFTDLLPPTGQWGGEKSYAELRAPVGFADGQTVEIVLADASPHALIGGPSGSGKTNLLLTMISSMAARYSPDELEFYLLDFKEGVSFAQFAPGRRDPTWLPHARLIGVNINTDREFGLALLQFLSGEMRRRAEVAKSHEVTKLEELRRAVGDNGRWPRIVAVIDEFQYLFSEKDAVTRAAMILLEDVSRRGRSQGIHLVLASQDVSGIEAFWGRQAIFEQFVLRIALPRARRVLADPNDVPLDLPRWHAVINHESGIRHGNEIARIPDATAADSVDQVRRKLHAEYQDRYPQPRLFDGSRAPRLADLVGQVPAPLDGVTHAMVGQCMDVEGSAAMVELPAAPGRNIGVLGTVGREAVRVLGSAAGSLAGQYPPGSVDVVIAPLVASAGPPAARLAELLTAAGHAPEIVGLDGFRARIEALAAEVTARLGSAPRRPTVLVAYAVDAADTVLAREGTEALRRLLRHGPETGVHVLGWWRSIQRLRTLLTMSASVDDLGAWVALDVQGSELGTLAPGMMLQWSPRPGRGLFFDRARHALPEVVIVPSLEES